MADDILKDIEVKAQVCYVDSKTKPLFQEMLNELGEDVIVGKNTMKYGDLLQKVDEEAFITLFHKWITKCREKGIIVKTFSKYSDKHLEWNQEYSEVERTLRSMSVLKEML